MFNAENFKRVLDHIKANPCTWDQEAWHCGSAHCFFGWAQIMSGHVPSALLARRDGRVWLGLSRAEAQFLSAATRTIADFEAAMVDPARRVRDAGGFDVNGYDSAGLDCHGRDRYGYDRNGRDRDGLDRNGFDTQGFDRSGHDRDGYNCLGFDDDGLDRNNNQRPQSAQSED